MTGTPSGFGVAIGRGPARAGEGAVIIRDNDREVTTSELHGDVS